jgi:hypothetical protein
MKNRFYGDKTDYIKYGLLDILTQEYDKVGINWYLTDQEEISPPAFPWAILPLLSVTYIGIKGRRK